MQFSVRIVSQPPRSKPVPGSLLTIWLHKSSYFGFASEKKSCNIWHTVDERNPAPLYKTLELNWLSGFLPSTVEPHMLLHRGWTEVKTSSSIRKASVKATIALEGLNSLNIYTTNMINYYRHGPTWSRLLKLTFREGLDTWITVEPCHIASQALPSSASETLEIRMLWKTSLEQLFNRKH